MTVEHHVPTEHDVSMGEFFVGVWGLTNAQKAQAQLKYAGKHSGTFLFVQGMNCPCCAGNDIKVGILAPTHPGNWAEYIREYLSRDYQCYSMLDEPPFMPTIPKDNQATVKGNGRQQIVQGKNHSWPAHKTRKGHR